MRKKSVWLLVAAAALVTSLAVSQAAVAKSDRALAGTVVFGHDQEPATLNNLITPGNAATSSYVTNLVLEQGQVYNSKAVLVPRLMDGKPKIVKANPFTVSFKYKANANWSDGKPVTGNDFKARYDTIMNASWDIISRTGYEDIASIAVAGKSVTIVFKKPYARWEVLVSDAPLPAHKVAGQNFNDLWKNGIDVASGPYKFASWQRGTQLVLERNTAYKANAPAKLDRLVFRYIINTASLFQALASNEVQVMFPQPQLQIVEVRKDTKFTVQEGPGYTFEHVDFQLGAKGHPALKQRYVRQAIMLGINRAQIREALYVAPGLISSKKQLPVLQSLIYKTFEDAYKPNFAVYEFSQRNALDLLKKAKCTGGPDKPTKGNTKIWECPGVGKLSFRFNTTSGNQLRALTFEIMQQQLKSVGIELVPRFAPNALTQILPSGDWDISLYAWLSGPTSSIDAKNLYGCKEGQNYMNYCSKKVTDLLLKVVSTLEESKRTALLQEAERIMVRDVPSIPIFVRPLNLVNRKAVSGPVLNPTQQGPTWNADLWNFAS